MIIVIVIEAYYMWIETTASPKILATEPFVAESGFYYCILNILLGIFTLFLLIKLLTPKMNSLLLWKAITVAQCSKFLLLPITIWKENLTQMNSTLHIFLLNSHFLLALMQIYLAITISSRSKTILIVLFAFTVKFFLMMTLSFDTSSINQYKISEY